jgi:hypothetical protein
MRKTKLTKIANEITELRSIIRALQEVKTSAELGAEVKALQDELDSLSFKEPLFSAGPEHKTLVEKIAKNGY